MSLTLAEALEQNRGLFKDALLFEQVNANIWDYSLEYNKRRHGLWVEWRQGGPLSQYDQLSVARPGSQEFWQVPDDYIVHALLAVAALETPDAAVQWLERLLRLDQVTARLIFEVHGLNHLSCGPFGQGEIISRDKLKNTTITRPRTHNWTSDSFLVVTIPNFPWRARPSEGQNDWATDVHKDFRQRLNALAYLQEADTAPVLGARFTDFDDADLRLLRLSSGAFRWVEEAPHPFGFLATYDGTLDGQIDRHMSFEGDFGRRMKLAAERFALASRRRGLPTCAIDLGIVFETLLGDDGRMDLTYKLPLRGALMMTSDIKERETIRANIKALYAARSALVHGTPWVGKYPFKATNEALILAKNLLKVCYRLGRRPDFARLENGGSA